MATVDTVVHELLWQHQTLNVPISKCYGRKLGLVEHGMKAFQQDANRSLANCTCFIMNKFEHVRLGAGEVQ